VGGQQHGAGERKLKGVIPEVAHHANAARSPVAARELQPVIVVVELYGRLTESSVNQFRRIPAQLC
ncbi:hypothetical protein SB776_41870, partial [Burkholderia sp. SIMBA_045]